MFNIKDLQTIKKQPQVAFFSAILTWTLQKCRTAFLSQKQRFISRGKNGLECVGLYPAKNSKTLRLNVILNSAKCPPKSAPDCKPQTHRVDNGKE